MFGRGVIDEELPGDAPDQRRGAGDVENGSKSNWDDTQARLPKNIKFFGGKLFGSGLKRCHLAME